MSRPALVAGREVEVIAFGTAEAERMQGSGFLGLGWPVAVEIAWRGRRGRFASAEAALAALRLCDDARAWAAFAAAPDTDAARSVARAMVRLGASPTAPDPDTALRLVLAAKFARPDCAAALLATGAAVLFDRGARTNRLGRALMALRAAQGGAGDPCPGFDGRVEFLPVR